MISKEQLLACMPSITVENLNKYIDPLNQAMIEFEINNKSRIANFLAQIAHESGCLKYNKEIASGEAYDTGALAIALGNTPEADGDGQRYKGRGIIQITGLGNYKALSTYEFSGGRQDFVAHPELLEGPVWGCMAAGWFWDVKKKINLICDLPENWTHERKGKMYSRFEWITLLVNGGQNGIEQRKKYYQLAELAII
jgi:putative chitinase